MSLNQALHEAVDWRNGRIAAGVNFDEQLYRTERRKVFDRAWLVVGHEQMIPRPGDYVSNYMGEVPVIVVRDSGSQVRVLVNRCPHRGNQICVHDRGKTKGFTCSYHGWSFSLDGTLVGAPMEKALYGRELDKAQWSVERVKNVASFHGLIFASFDPDAPPLEQWLDEDTRWWLENFVLALPLGGLEVLHGFHRNSAKGNWKIVAENYIGDNYHFFAATHHSYFSAVSAFQNAGELIPIVTYPDVARAGVTLRELSCGGNGRATLLGLGLVSIEDDVLHEQDLADAKRLGREAVEWVEYRHRRLSEVLADRPRKPFGFMNGLLFPNLGLMGNYSPMLGRHFHLFHPRGVLEHESWQWTMVEKDAPQSVKDIAVQRVYQGQYMAGLLAPDDIENFERIVDAGRPERSWSRPMNYGLQLDREVEGESGLPGRLGPNPNEMNQRQFYRCWLQMMEAA